MSEGDFRKLQLTGGSTMIVSLPKTWVKGNRLDKGDVVSIEELASGDLRISPMQGKDAKTCVSIDCCSLTVGLVDLLIGAYLSGTNTIEVNCDQKIPRSVRNNIRDFLRDTRGMEIEDDTEEEEAGGGRRRREEEVHASSKTRTQPRGRLGIKTTHLM